MLIKTRYFGEIDVDDQKIITFDDGLIGFEVLLQFTHGEVLHPVVFHR